MSGFDKKIPSTVTGEVGTAKRNIIRKGGPGRSRKDGLAGKTVDDGSIYDDPYALDNHDPNYDSEEDFGKVAIPKYSGLHRTEIAKSKMTLTAYKKKVQSIIAEFFVNADIEDIACSLEVIDCSRVSYLYNNVSHCLFFIFIYF